ncbi:hypothetical protein QBC38DRAFT_524113 [Podospora fimiseda]|uniref:Uncharacterized protein n=1 Tax=Podospora fimiseda TaxID=252190 RepID=A0AAN6YM84_9PEZI|nr:hypothetical protein QBC38DRAFT_524113 [Podospora fimiseda]
MPSSSSKRKRNPSEGGRRKSKDRRTSSPAPEPSPQGKQLIEYPSSPPEAESGVVTTKRQSFLDKVRSTVETVFDTMEEEKHEGGSIADQHRQHYPVVTQRRLDKLLKPVFSDKFWSKEEEEELETEWELHTNKQRIEELDADENEAYLDVWRTILQYFDKCLPTYFISSHSRYSLSIKDANDIFWPRDFCEALLPILIHPLWAPGNLDSLAMVLQLAVIARTRDDRHWRFRNVTDSKFLDHFAECARNNNPANLRFRLPLRDMFNASKATFERQFCATFEGHKPPWSSPWYRLFEGIIDLAMKEEPTTP